MSELAIQKLLKVNASATTFCRLYGLGDLLASFSPRRPFAVFFLVANQIRGDDDLFAVLFWLLTLMEDKKKDGKKVAELLDLFAVLFRHHGVP